MWSSLCSFLSRKLFSKSATDESPPSCDSPVDPIYGKRLKLSYLDYDTNGSLNQPKTPERFLMQAKKKLTNSNDDGEECHIIAEELEKNSAGPSSFAIGRYADVLQEKSTMKNYLFSPFSLQRPTYQKKDDSNSESDSIAKSPNKNFKFFNTPRSDPTKKKPTKSKKDYMGYPKRKSNSLQQSFWPKELQHYEELLMPSRTTRYSAPVRPLSPRRQKKRSETKGVSIVDLTTEKTSKGNKRSKSTSKIVRRKTSEEDDVQFIQEVPGVNTCRESCTVEPANTKKAKSKIRSKKVPKSSPEVIRFIDSSKDAVGLPDNEDDKEKKTYPQSLEERLNAFMHISKPTTTEVKKDEYVCELTLDGEKKIEGALKVESSQEVLIEKFGIKITRRDMNSLSELCWVNDDIINFYMHLIMERSKENSTLPKVYAFNTFFYPKLLTGGHAGLKRWTKTVDIFSFDILLVPVHLGMHWCLAVIDFRSQTLKYYDSMGGDDYFCLENLLTYLAAEKIDKKSEGLDVNAWIKRQEHNIPQQLNGSDCGVFVCIFAEYIARNGVMLFDQASIPYFRKKMALEMLEGKLLT